MLIIKAYVNRTKIGEVKIQNVGGNKKGLSEYKIVEPDAEGKIKPVIYKTYGLDDVAIALQDLASRKTYGKVIIEP